ncbi:MAG: endonuclease NucS [candidate division Zixibacteria bacterium]|nr:endonuclease NucS [candidate division Zixibacteria bacterium]
MELQEAIQIVKQRYQTDIARINEEKAVIEKFGFMFHSDNLDRLTAENFKSFLLIKNNKHWTGIHRQGNIITSDMDKLRKVLKLLVDESKPIEERLDEIIPKNPKNKPLTIKGLGRAVLTPILLVVHRDKYAVYNSIAEEGMRKFDILPKLKAESFAEKYVKINKKINDLAEKDGLSLWQMDDVWYEALAKPFPPEETRIDEATEVSPDESEFEEIIIREWDRIPAFNGLEILQEDGDLKGQQFNTNEVGKIDLLCRSKETGDFVVVELKRGKESDKVVGQALRYIGWVRKNLANKGQKVAGLIITKEEDTRLNYALEPIKDLIQLKFYKISIKITDSISHSL